MNKISEPMFDLKTLQEKLVEDLNNLMIKPLKLKSLSDLNKIIKQTSTANKITTTWKNARNIQKENRIKVREEQKKIQERLLKIPDDRIAELESLIDSKPVKIPPSKYEYLISGKVIDKQTKIGIPDLVIRVFDIDSYFKDKLGSTHTDNNGNFKIIYNHSQHKDIFEKKPKIYIKVFDKKGKELHKTDKLLTPKINRVEPISIEMDGNKFKELLKIAELSKKKINQEIEIIRSKKELIQNRILIRSFRKDPPKNKRS